MTEKIECYEAGSCKLDPACFNNKRCNVDLKPKGPGPIEQAVEEDLAGLGDKILMGRRALAAAARKLARVIDARGEDEPASQTAKAVDTLRITMHQISSGEVEDANVKAELLRILSTPSTGGSAVSAEVRYPKEP